MKTSLLLTALFSLAIVACTKGSDPKSSDPVPNVDVNGNWQFTERTSEDGKIVKAADAEKGVLEDTEVIKDKSGKTISSRTIKTIVLVSMKDGNGSYNILNLTEGSSTPVPFKYKVSGSKVTMLGNGNSPDDKGSVMDFVRTKDELVMMQKGSIYGRLKLISDKDFALKVSQFKSLSDFSYKLASNDKIGSPINSEQKMSTNQLLEVQNYQIACSDKKMDKESDKKTLILSVVSLSEKGNDVVYSLNIPGLDLGGNQGDLALSIGGPASTPGVIILRDLNARAAGFTNIINADNQGQCDLLLSKKGNQLTVNMTCNDLIGSKSGSIIRSFNLTAKAHCTLN
jgi:hypothetical protein